jgi:hypothetical protein
MTPYEVPETVVRRFTENGCEVTAISQLVRGRPHGPADWPQQDQKRAS